MGPRLSYHIRRRLLLRLAALYCFLSASSLSSHTRSSYVLLALLLFRVAHFTLIARWLCIAMSNPIDAKHATIVVLGLTRRRVGGVVVSWCSLGV